MNANNIVLVPRPAYMEPRSASLDLRSVRRIAAPSVDGIPGAVAALLADWLSAYGTKPAVVEESGGQPGKGQVALLLDEAMRPEGEEAYALDVAPDGVVIRAGCPAGLHHGAQTLRQLLPETAESESETRVPCVYIQDRPRFPWRGLLLDCCRHFMTPEYVKRTIDLLAYHKMSRFHWHLTEDQGWRVEIDAFPKLTEVGAWRGEDRYGGFYSKETIREIVQYAADRGIVVVPEIEMPGHCTAAVASYPEFSCTGGPFEVAASWGIFKDVYCAGNDATFAFLETVLEEVMDLFPAPYIHIGGDECPKDRWRECPKCRERIRKEGLADEDELQSYFVRRIGAFLARHGRKMVGWDEIMQGGLAEGAVVQAWRDQEHAATAARMGHDTVVSPTSHCYIDYDVDRIDLRRVHSFEPVPEGLAPEAATRVLGGECTMWTERAPQETIDGKVFPRLCGLAEVLWSPLDGKDWNEFHGRMQVHARRLEALGVSLGQDPSFVREG